MINGSYVRSGLNSHYFHIIGDGHQPNSKDSLLHGTYTSFFFAAFFFVFLHLHRRHDFLTTETQLMYMFYIHVLCYVHINIDFKYI